MHRDTLKALQAPLKDLYKANPEAAVVQLHATGNVDFAELLCRVPLPANNGSDVIAGLHPLAGGDGSAACSAEILLQALVTCAGTTMAAVATAMGLSIRTGQIQAVGTLDFRGTLGVDRNVPVGFSGIELCVHFESDAPADQLDKLIELTERYCVVLQTLQRSVPVSMMRAN